MLMGGIASFDFIYGHKFVKWTKAIFDVSSIKFKVRCCVNIAISLIAKEFIVKSISLTRKSVKKSK